MTSTVFVKPSGKLAEETEPGRLQVRFPALLNSEEFVKFIHPSNAPWPLLSLAYSGHRSSCDKKMDCEKTLPSARKPFICILPEESTFTEAKPAPTGADIPSPLGMIRV